MAYKTSKTSLKAAKKNISLSKAPISISAPKDSVILFPESPDPSAPTIMESPIPQFATGSENINLTRETFNRKQFDATVNTNFTQLGVSNTEADMSFFNPSLATVGDFFTLYEQFFYDIPKEGDTNSHTYLAQTSGEYANFELVQEEIQALLEEIGEIRLENVELRTSQSLLEVELASANATILATQFREI